MKQLLTLTAWIGSIIALSHADSALAGLATIAIAAGVPLIIAARWLTSEFSMME